jgi:hypothetical protein
VSFLVAIAPSSLSKRIKKYPLVRSVVETKEEGKWNFKHSWRALNEAFPPKVRPMTVLRAFLAAAPYISKTNSEGKSASKTKLGSTGDGPWGSAPVGMIDLGLLLGCVGRAEFRGVAEEVSGRLPRRDLSLGTGLLVWSSPLAERLSASAPRASELGPFLITAE